MLLLLFFFFFFFGGGGWGGGGGGGRVGSIPVLCNFLALSLWLGGVCCAEIMTACACACDTGSDVPLRVMLVPEVGELCFAREKL